MVMCPPVRNEGPFGEALRADLGLTVTLSVRSHHLSTTGAPCEWMTRRVQIPGERSWCAAVHARVPGRVAGGHRNAARADQRPGRVRPHRAGGAAPSSAPAARSAGRSRSGRHWRVSAAWQRLSGGQPGSRHRVPGRWWVPSMCLPSVARLWLQTDPHKRSARIEVIDGRERVLA